MPRDITLVTRLPVACQAAKPQEQDSQAFLLLTPRICRRVEFEKGGKVVPECSAKIIRAGEYAATERHQGDEVQAPEDSSHPDFRVVHGFVACQLVCSFGLCNDGLVAGRSPYALPSLDGTHSAAPRWCTRRPCSRSCRLR